MKINFRYLIFSAFWAVFLTAILLRFLDLQLWQYHKFEDLANNNRNFSLPIKASRGLIFDRYDRPLLLNQRQYY